MARIPTYQKDVNISDLDSFLGTDGDSNELTTKNFHLGDVANYVIDKLIDPDATDFQIPVFNQSGNRITGSIMSQDSSLSNGVAGTKITIAGDLTLERDQSDTTLTLISDGSNPTPGGEQHNPSIKFIQDGGAQNAAIGFNIIDDTGGGTIPGTGNRFWIVNAMEDNVGEGGITFGTAQVDGWDNAIGRFMIRGDGKGLFGHPDSLYNKTLGSQFEIYDNRDDNTTTDPSFSVYSVVDVAAPSGNEGAGGIKQILDVYDNGVFSEQQALMLIPGTSASDFAASTPIAFYTNSDMDTASPSGFAGMIFNSGNWLLDGSGTFTTADPGYQLKVAGTGFFTDQVTIPITPVAGTDAASKDYVDSQFSGGSVTGTGTTNTLPVWSDGPNGVLGDSGISETIDSGGNISNILITTTQGANPLSVNFGAGGTASFKRGATKFIELKTDNPGGFYTSSFRYGDRLTVDRASNSFNPSLDVGDSNHTYPAAWFRNGVVISNNPSGVQVDNTSMVIGAGNNAVISGSDNCLAIGNNNQILSDSDNSLAVGQGNIIRNNADNSFAIGQGNTVDGTGATQSVKSQVLGYQNSLTGSFSSFIAGGQNTVTTGQNAVALGFSHTLSGADSMFAFGENNTGPSGATDNNSFMIGGNLTGADGNMVLGFRNDTSSYPATDYSNGLGNTKFAVSVGTVTNSNAIIITEGGVNRGGGVAQVPRVVLPTVVEFNFANDADAASNGIPVGGIYHHNGNLKIRIT